MSTFTVKLNQAGVQGQLDTYPVAGVMTQPTTSLQRTVYIMGPDKHNYLLKDGDSFTGNNYWLRYVSTNQTGGQARPEDAILYCTSNDGSTYSDDGDNITTVVLSETIEAVGGAGTWETVDIVGSYGGYAKFVQIVSDKATVIYRINGNTTASFTLAANTPVVYEPGELNWSSISFNNYAGVNTGNDATVKLVLGVHLNNRITIA